MAYILTSTLKVVCHHQDCKLLATF